MNDDELTTLLRDARPAVEPDAGGRAGGRAKLHAEFGRAGAAGATPARRRRRLRLGVWFAAPGLVAGAVAVALVVTQAVGPGEAPRRHAGRGHASTTTHSTTTHKPDPNVVRTLELAAHTVALQDGGRPRPHQWIYTSYVTHKGGKVHETWTRFDGRKAAGYSTVPGHEGFEISDLSEGQGENTPAQDYDFFASLPTDPVKLRQVLYEESRRADYGTMSRDAGVFEYVYDFFEDSPLIPPKNLAALYRALATLPGVTVDRHATDAVGHPGIAVTHDQGGGFMESLILDKKDYHVIGQQTVDAHGKKRSYAVAVPRVVDKPGQRR